MKIFQKNLSVTTQGPLYPPSEIMDKKGNFIVIGRIIRQQEDGAMSTDWGAAIVSSSTELPPFGQLAPYSIVNLLDFNDSDALTEVLYTLPIPLPCNNYPMIFAPEQNNHAHTEHHPSLPLHQAKIPDYRFIDGRKVTSPITLKQWISAQGSLCITLDKDNYHGLFVIECTGLIPNSLYTVMSLRQNDLNPHNPTRPGPLGIPNVMITDEQGNGHYSAKMPNPFPDASTPGANRIINVVVLWMSRCTSHGGAIGVYGLGGDIHAQLKLEEMIPETLITQEKTP